jgi:uncharacterized protein (TIRG00374 family)
MKNFKKNLIYSIILSLGVIILIFLFSFFKEGISIFKIKINYFYIFISSLIVLSIWFFEVIRLKIILNFFDIKIGYFYLLYIHLIGYFFSAITPLGTGGFAAKVYLISKKKNFEIGNIVSILTFMYLLNMFIYLFFSIFLIFSFRNLRETLNLKDRLIFFIIIFILLLSLLIFIILVLPEIFRKLSHKILSLFKKLSEEKRENIAKIINLNFERFVNGMKNIRKLKFKILPIVFLTTLSFFILNSLSYFLLKSLNVNSSFLKSFLLQFIYHFFSGWSVTPGGSGISEAIYSSLFINEVTLSKITYLLILFKFFTYYVYIFIGGVLTFKELKSFLDINKIYEKS